MFKSPINFAENIRFGKHIALFYEDAEYARSISFAFFKSGMENREHCFYFTSEGDTDFFRNEFIEIMYGPNVTYEYNINSNSRFEENLLHLGNFEIVDDYVSAYSLTKNIIDVVNKISQARDKDESVIEKTSKYSRVILKFNNKIKSKEYMVNNILWETNFRNTLLRKDLPNTSLLSAYPLDRLIETVNGESALLSNWMSELLELYDGVIYAKANWKGVGFDLDR